MTVYAPLTYQSGKLEPYITLNELRFSATASSIDFEDLIKNAGLTGNDKALQELIWRASAHADLYCLGRSMGTTGTLNATVNTEPGRYRQNRRGQFIVHPAFAPIIGVVAFSIGPGSNALNIPLSASNVEFDEEEFIISSAYPQGIQFGSLSQVVGGVGAREGKYYCLYTYVCGYANSFLTAACAPGATELLITDPTGLQPGQPMMLWDAALDEQVIVDPSWVVESSPVLLSTPTQYAHGVGVNFSALPLAVKQAVIHLVVGMVKSRGQGGLVLEETGAESSVGSRTLTNVDEFEDAYDLLDEFRMTWGKL